MKQVLNLKIQVIKKALLVGVIVVIALFLLGYGSFAFGFLFGTILAILNWLLLSKTIEKSVSFTSTKAKVYTVLHFFIRFTILFIALYIAAMREDMHILGAILALLLPKAVIFWDHVILEYLKKDHRESNSNKIE
ncbi:ATP synthase subunit I [Natranaerobius trueperi]|nr:ATP synthase subunit I [Natranaerobius trueperi]